MEHTLCRQLWMVAVFAQLHTRLSHVYLPQIPQRRDGGNIICCLALIWVSWTLIKWEANLYWPPRRNGLSYSAVCLPYTSHNGEREGGREANVGNGGPSLPGSNQPVRPSVETRRRIQNCSEFSTQFPTFAWIPNPRRGQSDLHGTTWTGSFCRNLPKPQSYPNKLHSTCRVAI